MSNYHSNYTQWFYFPLRQAFGYVEEDGTYWIKNGGWGGPIDELEDTFESKAVMMVPTHCMLIDQLDDWRDQMQLVEDLYVGHIGSIYPKSDDLDLTGWGRLDPPKQTLGNFSLEDF